MSPWLRRTIGRLPLAGAAYRLIRDRLFAGTRRRRRFEAHYETNYWRDSASRSGPGSSLEQTAAIRRELPVLCRTLGIRSILDVPCGDFHWMRSVELDDVRYVGIDIVGPLIRANRGTFGGPGRQFLQDDIVRRVPPRADLVLCRDLLVHLPFADAMTALRHLKRSGSTWLLTTTFAARDHNDELAGDWRTLNLEKPPFDFPPPTRLVNEDCTQEGGRYGDKSLGLWRLAELDV